MHHVISTDLAEVDEPHDALVDVERGADHVALDPEGQSCHVT